MFGRREGIVSLCEFWWGLNVILCCVSVLLYNSDSVCSVVLIMCWYFWVKVVMWLSIKDIKIRFGIFGSLWGFCVFGKDEVFEFSVFFY